MTFTYYTRFSKADQWTQRTSTSAELAEDLEHYIELGYYIKFDHNEV